MNVRNAETGTPQPPSPMAVIVDAAGIRSAATPVDVQEEMVAKRFFWLDIFGGDEAARTDFLNRLGLEADDVKWTQRFGQTSRMMLGRRKLRAVSWLVGSSGRLVEVHLLSCERFIVTLSKGDSDALEDVRERFSTRIGYLDQSHYQAAGILLQLLLGTLNLAIAELDLELSHLQARLSEDPASLDDTELVSWRDKSQSLWSRFERYSSFVRSAVVGVEVMPGMDARGAAELNDYADHVEDLEHRLHERSQWLANIMRDYATSIAQQQSEQISRLTVVTVFFLPITFLSGLFGMNFNWMINHIGSSSAFLVLGLLLPALSACVTVALFMRRGLLFIKRRPLASGKHPRNDVTVAASVRPK
jgi:Mg2+ and Co2+ transporter CorA